MYLCCHSLITIIIAIFAHFFDTRKVKEVRMIEIIG